MCGCLFVAPTGDLAYNPGMCPDWESSWWPFGSQAGTQSSEPHQPGPRLKYLMRLKSESTVPSNCTPHLCVCVCVYFLNPRPRWCLLILEIGRRRERVRETLMWERKILLSCLWYLPWPGIKPQPYWMTLHLLNHWARAVFTFEKF